MDIGLYVGLDFHKESIAVGQARTGREDLVSLDVIANDGASARGVLRCLVDGLRWVSPDLPLRVSGISSISRARARLGAAPFSALRESCVAPVAHAGTAGA